jgi:hypothetical protein
MQVGRAVLNTLPGPVVPPLRWSETVRTLPAIRWNGKPGPKPRFALGLFPAETDAARDERIAGSLGASWNALFPDSPIDLDAARAMLERLRQSEPRPKAVPAPKPNPKPNPNPIKPPSIYDLLAGRIGIDAYRAAKGIAAPAPAATIETAAKVDALTWCHAVTGHLQAVATAEQVKLAIELLNSDWLSGVKIVPVGPSLAALESAYRAERGGAL